MDLKKPSPKSEIKMTGKDLLGECYHQDKSRDPLSYLPFIPKENALIVYGNDVRCMMYGKHLRYEVKIHFPISSHSRAHLREF